MSTLQVRKMAKTWLRNMPRFTSQYVQKECWQTSQATIDAYDIYSIMNAILNLLL